MEEQALDAFEEICEAAYGFQVEEDFVFVVMRDVEEGRENSGLIRIRRDCSDDLGSENLS